MGSQQACFGCGARFYWAGINATICERCERRTTDAQVFEVRRQNGEHLGGLSRAQVTSMVKRGALSPSDKIAESGTDYIYIEQHAMIVPHLPR